MIAQVFQLTGSATRSVRRAVLVAEVEVESVPKNQNAFAFKHGGDFIEIVRDTLPLGDLWPSTSR